jgi:hypothetical protein
VGVCLAVREARKAVEPVAPHAASGFGVGFVEVDPDRQVERVVTDSQQVVMELLDPRLMGDGGIWE